MRFELKGLLTGVGYNHHVDAYDEQGAAIEAAMRVYGYDRIFVIDTAAAGAVVWDSADAVVRPSSAPFADLPPSRRRDEGLDRWVRMGAK